MANVIKINADDVELFTQVIAGLLTQGVEFEVNKSDNHFHIHCLGRK